MNRDSEGVILTLIILCAITIMTVLIVGGVYVYKHLGGWIERSNENVEKLFYNPNRITWDSEWGRLEFNTFYSSCDNPAGCMCTQHDNETVCDVPHGAAYGTWVDKYQGNNITYVLTKGTGVSKYERIEKT